MDLIDGPSLLEWFRKYVRSSKHVKIGVAFWGAGAAKQLDLGKKGQETKIVCNLRTGGTNPREIETLIDAGAEVRHSDTLHAKVYLLDEGGAVGSSNVSANGLSFQGKECDGWTEANVVFGRNSLYQAAESRFHEIWKSAKPVEDRDLKEAEEAWSARRRHVPFQTGPAGESRTLLDVLKDNPASLADRRIYVCVITEYRSAAANKALEREQKKTGERHNLDAFEDWDEAPDDAYLVHFFLGPRGGLSFEGFWHMPKSRRQQLLPNKSTLLFCEKRENISGISKPGPMEEWKKLVIKLRDTPEWESDGACVEVGEFARRFLRWNG